MESGSMATDVMALARACPCAHGVQFSGGAGGGGWRERSGWQHSERRAKALPCRARIVVALPSCAMISTATVELACVRVPFRHLPPLGPAGALLALPKLALCPALVQLVRGHCHTRRASLNFKLQHCPKYQLVSLRTHVMTAAHIPIYCALCACAGISNDRSPGKVRSSRSLACFGPVGRRTSHRIGIASPAASKIGCTRRRNHAYRSPTCTYAVTARNPSMAGTVPNRTCRRVRCTWFLPEVDTETLALLFVSRGRDRATGRDNQATQEGARERLSAPSPPASSLPASSQPIDACAGLSDIREMLPRRLGGSSPAEAQTDHHR